MCNPLIFSCMMIMASKFAMLSTALSKFIFTYIASFPWPVISAKILSCLGTFAKPYRIFSNFSANKSVKSFPVLLKYLFSLVKTYLNNEQPPQSLLVCVCEFLQDMIDSFFLKFCSFNSASSNFTRTILKW